MRFPADAVGLLVDAALAFEVPAFGAPVTVALVVGDTGFEEQRGRSVRAHAARAKAATIAEWGRMAG